MNVRGQAKISAWNDPTSHCIVCGRPIPKRTTLREVSHHDQSAPRSIEDCRKLTNEQVLRVSYRSDGRVAGFTTWDGASRMSPFFCRHRCAIEQGYASAHHGARFRWKGK